MKQINLEDFTDPIIPEYNIQWRCGYEVEGDLFENKGFAEVLDSHGRQLYFEDAGYWAINEFEEDLRKPLYNQTGSPPAQIYFENSLGDWWQIVDNVKVEYKDNEYYLDGIKKENNSK